MDKQGLPRWLSVKEPTYNSGDTGSISGSGRPPGEGNGNPFPSAFLPGKSLGWRSRVGCSPWGCNEWDMTDSATKQQHTRKNTPKLVSPPLF